MSLIKLDITTRKINIKTSILDIRGEVNGTAVAGLLGACLAIILAYGLEARARRNAGLPG